MTPSQVRLVKRFRGSGGERIARIVNGVLDMPQATVDADRHAGLRRELHTLKGEARLVGFPAVGRIAHALEGLAGDEHIPELFDARRQDMLAGLDHATVVLAAEPDVENPAADAWATAAEAAVEDPDAAPAATPTAAPAPALATVPPPELAPTPRESALRVDPRRLDRLTDALVRATLAHARDEMLQGTLEQQILRQRELITRFQRSLLGVGPSLGPDAGGLAVFLARSRELLGSLEAHRKEVEEQLYERSLALIDLEEQVRALRFQPLAVVFSALPRVVHDVSQGLGRPAQCVIIETAIELDKAVLQHVQEVLVHLVNNAVDHAVEATDVRIAAGKPAIARIELSAALAGRRVQIVVRDDGRGIDVADVRARAIERGLLDPDGELDDARTLDLVFRPGFSMRSVVTPLSGRGVGLDVVRQLVEHTLGGTVRLETRSGAGTTVTLEIPTSAMLTPALLVDVSGHTVLVPVEQLRHVERVPRERLLDVGRGLVIALAQPDGTARRVPCRDLGETLGYSPCLPSAGDVHLLVEARADGVAWIISASVGYQTVTVRPPDPFVLGCRWLLGGVVLASGTPALLLNLRVLVREAASHGATAQVTPQGAIRRPTILVVDDSEFTREILIQALHAMDCDVIEAADGRQGVARFLSRPVDLVLADLDMPVLDGFGMMEQIRALPNGATVPIVVLSSRGSERDKQRAAAAGANAYLVKRQFQEGDLRRLVGEYTRYLGISR